MELIIKDLPEDVYRLVKLISNKEAKSIEQVVIEAIKSYYQEREIAYRKEMIHFDQDKGHQQKNQ